MLAFNAENPLHKHYRGPKRPTVKVPGINASDLNTTGQKSMRDCRLTDKHAPTIRVKAPVGVTGGHVEGAKGDPTVRYGRIPKGPKRPSTKARRRERQDAARKLLRAHGYNV